MGTKSVPLVEIEVGDDPVSWASIGFAVDDDGVTQVGQVAVRLVGAHDERGRGIVGWTLATATGAPADDLDGLSTRYAPPVPDDAETPVEDRPAAHSNGIVTLDHLVVMTPDVDRTTEALGAVGVEARRTRAAGAGRQQRFFRLGEVILEVVGPATPSGDGPATFWGLAFTVIDIDATAAHLSGRIGEPKAAVQAGRRIATLRTDDAVSVPIAVMSAVEAPDGGAPGDTSL